MPVETFGFLDSLNVNNPTTSDGLVGGDDHIRGIKATLKSTFPNISGAITATHAQLNALTAWGSSGATLLNHAGAYFDNGSGGASTDGFTNTLAGDIDVVLQGVIAATFQRTGGTNFLKVKGALQVDTTITAASITAAGIAPIGAMILWPSDTLPPTSDGVWVWANGASYLKATYPTANARIGDNTASTTFAVMDMQGYVPVGRNTMGGAAGNGVLSSISTALKNLLGAVFGTDTETLSTAQIPSHYHTAGIYDPGHTHGNNGNSGNSTTGGGGFACGGNSSMTISPAATGVRVNSANGLDTTASAGGGGSHNNLGPRKVVNFIIRLA